MKISSLGLMLITVLLFACSKQDEVAATSKSVTAAPTTAEATKQPISTAQKTYDGPFGLSMGIPLKELVGTMGFKGSEDPFFYEGTPPKPVDGMSTYFAIATEKQGICKIGAWIDVPVVNATGDQIKSEANKVAELLELKYGKYSKKHDYAGQEVYKRNPQFWMMALKEEAVVYAYIWNSTTNLPNNIKSIGVTSNATSINSGYISVQYEFNNFKDCQSEFKSKKSSNL